MRCKLFYTASIALLLFSSCTLQNSFTGRKYTPGIFTDWKKKCISTKPAEISKNKIVEPITEKVSQDDAVHFEKTDSSFSSFVNPYSLLYSPLPKVKLHRPGISKFEQINLAHLKRHTDDLQTPKLKLRKGASVIKVTPHDDKKKILSIFMLFFLLAALLFAYAAYLNINLTLTFLSLAFLSALFGLTAIILLIILVVKLILDSQNQSSSEEGNASSDEKIALSETRVWNKMLFIFVLKIIAVFLFYIKILARPLSERAIIHVCLPLMGIFLLLGLINYLMYRKAKRHSQDGLNFKRIKELWQTNLIITIIGFTLMVLGLWLIP